MQCIPRSFQASSAYVITSYSIHYTKLYDIGEGPLRAAWEAQARRRGLGGRVHFLGARDHAALPAYLAAADVLALPSVRARGGDRDGLPVTLLEAAACGLPAVASRLGGIVV